MRTLHVESCEKSIFKVDMNILQYVFDECLYILVDEGGELVFGSTDLALKIARIVDLCGKSSGLADFENTVDRGSVVIFDADSGLCLC